MVENIPAYLFTSEMGSIQLDKIIIPNSVTKIGAYAFYQCSSLTSVTIGENVNTIGDYAFSGCSKLKNIKLPESLISIGNNAFSGCGGLTSIYYNVTNCENIGSNIFTGSGSVEQGLSVIIGDNVKLIPNRLFQSTTYTNSGQVIVGVTSVYIGANVESIGDYAFSGCVNLNSVNIPNSVVSVGSSAFERCSSLTEITIPENVTNLGAGAFRYCYNLTSINFNAINCDDLTSNGYVFESAGKDGSGVIVTFGENVTKIPAYLFASSSSSTGQINLKQVLIGSKVTNIGNYAFSNCLNLTSITIPVNVTSIGNYVFSSCYNLEGVVIEDGLTSIGNYAFNGCSKIENIKLPESLITIGDSAFYNCSGLMSILIPNNTTQIGNNAFSDCSGLTSITIGEGVSTIGSYAFRSCYNLTEIYFNAVNCKDLTSNSNIFSSAGKNTEGVSVIIGEGVTKIPAYLFYTSSSSSSHNITNLIIGENVIGIGNYAFINTNLTSIIIPDNVEIIGNSAFSGCLNLMSVIIGKNVTSIGNYAFGSCYNLTEIHFNAVNCNDLTSNSSVFSGAGQKNEGVKVVFGQDVTKIPAYILYSSSSTNMSRIVDVIIGEGVTTIGNSAFYGSSNLVSLTIPNSVVTIESNAFYNCSNMTSINIGNSVGVIGNNSFNNTFLTDITINSSFVYNNATSSSALGSLLANAKNIYVIKSIDNGSNSYLTSDKFKLYQQEDNYNIYSIATFDRDSNGFMFASVKGGLSVVGYNGNSENVTIPETFNGQPVIEIGESCFKGNNNIKNINLPNSIVKIGHSAFAKCSNLTEFIIPDSVTNFDTSIAMERSPFYNCTGLRSVVIGMGLKSIPYSMFYNCSGLTSVVIPDNITSIGRYAFNNCSSLMSITIPDSVTSMSGAFSGCSNLASVILSKNITNIADSMFRDCRSLVSIEIPKGIVKIEASAFSNCSSLTYLELPDSIVSIGNSAFYNCANLRNIVLPVGITTINNSVFSGCKSLDSIIIPDSVTKIGESAFSNCSSLTNIVIPERVESIGRNAFSSCSNLIKIYFNTNVCQGITSNSNIFARSGQNGDGITVEFGDNVNIIPEYLFYTSYSSSAAKIKQVIISKNISVIGSEAFTNCSNLSAIYFEGSQDDWLNVMGNENIPSYTKILYYNEGCVHNLEEWRYLNNLPSQILTLGEWVLDKEPTYEEEGHRHSKCIVCGCVFEEDIKALAKYTIVNDEKYPYTIDGEGVLSSGNKGRNGSSSTYTITADEKPIVISLEYKVSSEKNYDKLTIKKGTEILVNGISGTTEYQKLSVTLQAGESLTITYSKDSGGAKGDDCCYIRNIDITNS